MIRAATVHDAAAIARVHARGWAHAYAGFLDPEAMTAHPIEHREARWRETLADPATRTWVWDQGDAIVAFATIGPARDDDAAEGVGELYAIYVDPHAQGAGLGTAMLSRAVGGLRDAGFHEAILWTFEQHGLARRFYEVHGWTAEPDSVHHGEGWSAPAIRYRRGL